MLDLRKITREFLLNESKKEVSIKSLIQALEETLKNIRAASKTDQRRLEMASHNLRETKKLIKRMESKIEYLEEKLVLLEESSALEE